MNEVKRPLDSGFFQFVDQRGGGSDEAVKVEKSDVKVEKMR